MSGPATSTGDGCVFCAIAAGEAEASVVHEDDEVIAFLDLHPVTPGHLLVVPKRHSVGLDDTDPDTGRRVWSVAHDLARALRRSSLRTDGVNLLLCDGAAAFQTVLHLHLHVVPRFEGDGGELMFPIGPAHDRALLERDAQAIREALAP
ncbi:HIT family protein [Amnibacterium sp. CER49]|uniref:HIT family protein n=1 Tax=Amnibacterium sp. CER49 TaxID=3039161 RepID=UPI00244CCF59|nr:HIT family protein [Amnibacterium sp. CER49]MDH2444268.1 HIT family protein [Amnibacterium sp. CER49]